MNNEYNELIENAPKLNDTLLKILENLQTMDLPKLNVLQQNDSIDRILDTATKYGKKLVDSKTVKNTNESVNEFFENAGDIAMIGSILMVAVTIPTLSTAYILSGCALFLVGATSKLITHRNLQLIRRTGKVVTEKTKKGKNKIKEKLNDKKVDKVITKNSIEETAQNKGKITATQFVATNMQRLTKNIEEINDKIIVITREVKKDKYDEKTKAELMTLLRNDTLNSIIKIQANMTNLANFKEYSTYYNSKINAVLVQGKIAIDTLSESMHITNKMVADRIEEINVKKNKKIIHNANEELTQ